MVSAFVLPPGFHVGDAHANSVVTVCGDATEDGRITSSDALYTLHVAVGVGSCSPWRCDCNTSGKITAADAMAILKHAVGLQVLLHCPPEWLPESTTTTSIVSTTTTSITSTTTTSIVSTTTTSLPAACGNGTVDTGEDCEPAESFCRGGCNPFTGICIDFLCSDDCRCPKPLCGDDMIDPNEACDPPGSPCGDGSGTCGGSCQCGP